MFAIPVYVAVLTGRRIADVLTVHGTREEAIAQCQKWTQKVTDLHPATVHPGYEFFAQYAGTDDTVRVEKHQLELRDDDDEYVGCIPDARTQELMDISSENGEGAHDVIH